MQQISAHDTSQEMYQICSPNTNSTAHLHHLKSDASSRAHEIDGFGRHIMSGKVSNLQQRGILDSVQSLKMLPNSALSLAEEPMTTTSMVQSGIHSQVPFKGTRNSSAGDRVPNELPGINESTANMKSKSRSIRRTKRKKNKGKEAVQNLRQNGFANEDFDANLHQFYLHGKNKVSKELVKNSYLGVQKPVEKKNQSKLLPEPSNRKGSTASVDSSMARAVLGADRVCYDKNYYRCASNEDISAGPSAASSRSNSVVLIENNPLVDTDNLRYSNKSGFNQGLLFPMAKKTNPPTRQALRSRRSSTKLAQESNLQQLHR